MRVRPLPRPLRVGGADGLAAPGDGASRLRRVGWTDERLLHARRGVVGAGPGLATRSRPPAAASDYEVVEKGTLVNSIYRFPRGMTFFTTAELARARQPPFVTPYAKPTREEALQYSAVVADTHRLSVALGERVESIGREGNAFVVTTRWSTREASRSARSGPGPERRGRHRDVRPAERARDTRRGPPARLHYFDEPHACHRRRVVVVGGATPPRRPRWRSSAPGAFVTLVHRRERLSARSVLGEARHREPDRGDAIAARSRPRSVRIGPASSEVEGPPGREELPATRSTC